MNEVIASTGNQKNKSRSNKWSFGGYIVAGLIWTLARSFRKSITDELIILIVAVGAGFLYYRLKSKIKFKNETVAGITAFVILYIISALLIGFLTVLG